MLLMVEDMRSKIVLFLEGLGRASSNVGKAAMLIDNMDISRLMVYVQQVEEEKMTNGQEYMNKKDKSGNVSGQQKGGLNRP